MMIVDAHMHIWNKIHGQIGGKTPVTPIKNGMIKIGDTPLLGMPSSHLDCSAVAQLAIAEFDAAGVDVGVVVQEYMDGPQNEYLLEAMKQFPNRFFGHALPNFFDKQGVAREAAALFAKGFRGLKLCGGHLAAQHLALDDPLFMPIYEQMAAQGAVLAVDLSTGEDQVPAMENILKHWPTLRVAIGHFGMVNRKGWPGQLRLCRHEHVYIETGGIVWLYRHEGYPFPGAISAIEQARREVGLEKLMWGSDWPRTMVDFTYRQSLDFVRKSAAFSEDEKQLLLCGNAVRLYGLAAPSPAAAPVGLITEG
jgi:predicted TIM-barrel fold metal-dependent hydrolase